MAIGEYLVIINDDVEVISKDSIQNKLQYAQKTGGYYASKTGLGQKADKLNVKFDFNTPIQALKRNGYKNYFSSISIFK